MKMENKMKDGIHPYVEVYKMMNEGKDIDLDFFVGKYLIHNFNGLKDTFWNDYLTEHPSDCYYVSGYNVRERYTTKYIDFNLRALVKRNNLIGLTKNDKTMTVWIDNLFPKDMDLSKFSYVIDKWRVDSFLREYNKKRLFDIQRQYQAFNDMFREVGNSAIMNVDVAKVERIG